MFFLTTLQQAIAKRRAYNRTVAELRTMPLDTALDLNIYPGDAEIIASRVVYGG